MFPEKDLDSDPLKTSEERELPRPSHPFHPGIDVTRHMLAPESAALMKAFFQKRRLSQSSCNTANPAELVTL